MGTATDLYVHAHAYMYVSLRVRVSGLRAVNKHEWFRYACGKERVIM